MPAPKRQRIEPSEDWQQLQLLLQWPEQILYELIRPVVIFGFSTAERAGHVRFRHWRIDSEHGLAGRGAAVWLYGESLLLEFSDEPLAQYSVAYETDHRQLRQVTPRQLFETRYRSPQLPLWELGDGEWLKVLRVPPSDRRPRRPQSALQDQLFD